MHWITPYFPNVVVPVPNVVVPVLYKVKKWEILQNTEFYITIEGPEMKFFDFVKKIFVFNS